MKNNSLETLPLTHWKGHELKDHVLKQMSPVAHPRRTEHWPGAWLPKAWRSLASCPKASSSLETGKQTPRLLSVSRKAQDGSRAERGRLRADMAHNWQP